MHVRTKVEKLPQLLKKLFDGRFIVVKAEQEKFGELKLFVTELKPRKSRITATFDEKPSVRQRKKRKQPRR